MHPGDGLDTPDALDAEYVPETIINRDREQHRLVDALSSPGIQNLYLHGPRGAGKTLVTRTALDTLDDRLTCHISCTR